MNALKTFDPPLHALDGSTLTGVARRGKHLVVESDAGLVLLIHLMSAGRLQLFDRRAGLRDRTSRVLIRLDDGRELRLREFGTKQAAWARLLRAGELDAEEAIATLGPEAWPDPPPFLPLLGRASRPLHTLLRDQRVIAGIGRSWVDEILWEARLSPFKRGADLSPDEADALRAATVDRLGFAIDTYAADPVAPTARQTAAAAEDPPARGPAVPALRHDARGGPLRGLRDRLLPVVPDGRARAQGPTAVEAVEVACGA